MNNIKVFEEEINKISDVNIKNILEEYLIYEVPEYFYVVPASTSGKYHPKQDLGEGGLVRHSKCVVNVGLDLLRCEQFGKNDNYTKDIVIVCGLIHDTFKCGEVNQGKTILEHPLLASEHFSKIAKERIEPITLHIICKCISSHMGIWNGEGVLPLPQTDIEKLVHLADYIASRKYIDMY